MAKAGAKKEINIAADDVWQTIRSFDGVDTYLPVVVSCNITGNEVGAKRHCTLENGMKLDETLEYLSDEERTLKYSINDEGTPFKGYMGTVSVRELPDGRAEVSWSTTFKANGAPEEELISMVEEMLGVAIDGLEKLHTA